MTPRPSTAMDFDIASDAEVNNINYSNDTEEDIVTDDSTPKSLADPSPHLVTLSPETASGDPHTTSTAAPTPTNTDTQGAGNDNDSDVVMVQNHVDGLLSAIRGYHNGIITGVRIRIPYILQSVIYAILFPSKGQFSKVRFVLKQMFYHGRNLGLYVMIYKTICNVCRNLGINNGIDSWIGGLVGGAVAFGENKGISGSVNNQLVLYLFARGIQGLIRLMQAKLSVPQEYDIRNPKGFRVFAGISLALILWLTEYHPEALSPSFNRTMHFLYYGSNRGPLRPPNRFLLAVIFITLTALAGFVFPRFRLDNILKFIDTFVTYENAKKIVQKCVALVRSPSTFV